MNSSYESFGVDDIWTDLDAKDLVDTLYWPPTQSTADAEATSNISQTDHASLRCCGPQWTGSSQVKALQLHLIAGDDSQHDWTAYAQRQLDVRWSNADQSTGWSIAGSPPSTQTASIARDLLPTSHAQYTATDWSRSTEAFMSRPCAPFTADAESKSGLFPELPSRRLDPPPCGSTANSSLHQQDPRSKSDLYTALWVRGERADRAGWCGYCCSWYKLKDSAYWVRLRFVSTRMQGH